MTSQTCLITIHNESSIDLDRGMLDFVMRKAAQHVPQAETINIFPSERVALDAPAGWNTPGWLEWTVRVDYRNGGSLTIGCIQRHPDAEFESHT